MIYLPRVSFMYSCQLHEICSNFDFDFEKFALPNYSNFAVESVKNGNTSIP